MVKRGHHRYYIIRLTPTCALRFESALVCIDSGRVYGSHYYPFPRVCQCTYSIAYCTAEDRQVPVNRPSVRVRLKAQNTPLISCFILQSITAMATFKGAPIWSMALTLLIPAVITYLSLFSGTRGWRIGLLPIALGAMWVMLWSYKFEGRMSSIECDELIVADDAPYFELSVCLP